MINKIKKISKIPLRFIDYQLNRVRPLWCTFALTENCNARCDYCQYWRKKHSEMSTETVLKIIKRLKELGIGSIVYSGGECLLRSDMTEVIDYTVKLGIEANLVSNGLISSEKLFHKLIYSGLSGMAFSLDGSTAAIHEAFRKGCSFETLIDSIKKAVEVRDSGNFNTVISTTTVVNKTNIDDLNNIYHLRKSLGADKNYFQPVWPVFGEEQFHQKFGFSHMDMEELERIGRELSKIPDGNMSEYYLLFPYLYKNFNHIAGRYRCFAARAFVYVDSSGNLYPCSPLSHKEPIASLKDDSYINLNNSDIDKRIKEYKKFECGGCTMACYMEKNIVLSGTVNPLSLLKRVKG